MKLEEMTWLEVDAYLKNKQGIILPTGSIEQHGPIGLIGTDSLCAREIAWHAAGTCEGIVAPEICYAPANFNMNFPGTISLSEDLFKTLVSEIIDRLHHHGFDHIYILNGHGANNRLLHTVAQTTEVRMRIRDWWEFETVQALRQSLYGHWEGMHATPSEVAITQATHRIVAISDLQPPTKLSPDFIKAHAGDRPGSPEEHRRTFPDGRVGSHSSLARPEHGEKLFITAAEAVASDFLDFCA